MYLHIIVHCQCITVFDISE